MLELIRAKVRIKVYQKQYFWPFQFSKPLVMFKFLTSVAVLIVSLFLFLDKSQAQNASEYQKKTFISSKGDTLPYRILFPKKYNPQKRYPLVLFLHGSGERGSDNEAQLAWGADVFLEKKNCRKYPCIVVFPQCPKEESWTVVDWRNQVFDYTLPATQPLQSSIELTRHLMKTEAVDTQKVVVMGLSMGGMGTFEAAYRNPKLFSAALPICGGGQHDTSWHIGSKTEFWIFHGGADDVVPVNMSRKMVQRLQSDDYTVRYSEYAGVDHFSWVPALKEKRLMQWMFKKR